MKVTICGPNLRDQSKGQFHIHADGCGDLKHYGPEGRYGGEHAGWTIEAESALDVSAAVYTDQLGDYGLTPDSPEGRNMLDDWLSDFHFAPCVTLPAKPAPKPRTKRPPLKRASYIAGIEWIALNDEPDVLELEVVSDAVSVLLLADLFGQQPELVAGDIVRFREKERS